jgi:hypothetical protein
MCKSFKADLIKSKSIDLVKPVNGDTIVSKFTLGDVGNTLNIDSTVRIQTIALLSLIRSLL